MITAITGENDFLIKEFIDNLKSDYLDKYGDMSIELVDCEESDVGNITQSMINLPFLVEKKLTILYSPSKNKQFTDIVEKVSEQIPDNVQVIFVENKLDKGSLFYKFIKGKTDLKEFASYKDSELYDWIVSYVNQNDGQISRDDARFLADYVGGNQIRLSNEIKKLVTNSKLISRESILKLTVPSIKSTIFELIELSLNGDSNKALILYEEQKQLGVDSIQVINLMTWQLNILALIKTSKGKSINQIASESKINPYSLNKSKRLADSLSYMQLKRYIRELYEIDKKHKTSSLDTDQALQGYIMSLSSLKQ